MSSGIFLIQGDNDLVEMREQPYDSGNRLQELLERFPNLLACDQIGDGTPRRWLLVRREAGVPSAEDGGDRWAVDHLFLDQDAIPTLVETKRSQDTRIRREVVGQMLDYAANTVAFCPVTKLREDFQRTCSHNGKDPDQELHNRLGEGIDIEQFWTQVQTNLTSGNIRLLFVSDAIPPELERVIQFLNERMTPTEVLAIEVRHYSDEAGQTQTLVPRVLGQSPRKAPISRGRTWDEATFLDTLKASVAQRPDGANAVATAQRLLDWGKQPGGYIWWGKGEQWGSFFPMFKCGGTEHWTISVWTYGRIEIQFEMLKTREPFRDEGMRRELLFRLNKVPGVHIPADAIGRRPSIPLADLDENGTRAFLAVLDWMVDEVRRTVAAGE